MPQICIPLSSALEIMAAVLDVEADAAFKSRVRALTDLGVPRIGRDRPHQRLLYGLPELSEMTLALLLTSTGIAPSAVARLVRENWRTFAPAAFEACRELMPVGYSEQSNRRTDGPFALIEGGNLREAGKQGMRKERQAGQLPEIATFAPETSLSDAMSTAALGVVVNASAFMPGLVRALQKYGVVPEDTLDSLDALRQSERDRSQIS